MALLRGAAALVVVALVLAGCAMGGDEESDEVTAEQLAVMVLPQDELGAPEGFEVDPEDSGRMSARDAADWTSDPRDNAADLRQNGWLNGYELTYSDPESAVSFQSGEGVITGESNVQLFDTETSARAQLLEEVRDLERLRGKEVDGVRLARFETFDLTIGDEAWGVELTARARGVTLHGTGVYFRSGRVVADTGFLHVDEAGRRTEAVAAAQALESRIQRLLAGELDAKRVPIPGDVPELTESQLSKMTLTLDDLPPGALVASQGREQGERSTSYHRVFDVSGTMIGSSHLISLRSETEVFATKADAQLRLEYISTAKGRALFARGVVGTFKKLTGTKPRNLRVTPMPGTRGDSTGIVVTFDAGGQRFRTATVVVRSGRALAIVSGFCTAHAVHPGDMPRLGELARARVASVPV